MWRLLAVLLFAIPTSQASSSANGLYLLRTCTDAIGFLEKRPTSGSTMTNAGYCIGYIQGFVEANDAVKTFKGQQNALFCKDGLETEQSIRIIMRYMQENPKGLDAPAHLIVLVAMGKAFPCHRK